MKEAPNGIQDPDLCNVDVALKRSAEKARALGKQTGTPVFVLRDGKIVDLMADAANHKLAEQ